MSQMRSWVAEELNRLHRMDVTNRFLFTCMPSGEVSTEEFLQPVWVLPDIDERVALLPL